MHNNSEMQLHETTYVKCELDFHIISISKRSNKRINWYLVLKGSYLIEIYIQCGKVLGSHFHAVNC